jgi:flagellar assembly protein FliH
MEAMLQARFQEGIEAGRKALAEQLVEQRNQLLQVQNGILRSLEQALPGVIAECEQSIVLLAFEAARRIVGALPVTAESIEASVKQALAELRETADYQVYLHPADLAVLREIQSGLLPAAGNASAKFSADASISRGGCIVRTRHGSIEALREKMFERLERAVLC